MTTINTTDRFFLCLSTLTLLGLGIITIIATRTIQAQKQQLVAASYTHAIDVANSECDWQHQGGLPEVTGYSNSIAGSNDLADGGGITIPENVENVAVFNGCDVTIVTSSPARVYAVMCTKK